jgi:hypothetical protein
MNCKQTLFPVLIILLLATSCAPSKVFVNTSPGNGTRISGSEHIGIINDVCLQIDPLFKKDYVLLDDSKVASTFMATEAKNYLEQKGYSIDYTASPFVGSFLPPQNLYRLCDEKGSEIRTESPPFYVEDSDSTGNEYYNAVMHILNEVYFTMTNNYNPLFSTDSLFLKDLSIISSYTGEDKILFMIGNGVIVPLGKSLLQGFTLGILTTVISFGMFTYYIYDTSSLNTYIMLLDLHSGEMLWSNSMKLTDYNPDQESFYSNYWTNNLLYYFPVRENTLRTK